jgi:hypothetical protein
MHFRCYPESYWLKVKVFSGEDSGIFKEGVVVSEAVNVRFEGAKKLALVNCWLTIFSSVTDRA